MNSRMSDIQSSGCGYFLANPGAPDLCGTGSMVGHLVLNNSSSFVLESLNNSSPIEGTDRMGGIFGSITLTNGSHLELRNISNSGGVSQPTGAFGNSNGGIGGMIVANGTNGSEVRIHNVTNSANMTTLTPQSGTWEGLLLGQLQMGGGLNNILEITDVDLTGNITSAADYFLRAGAIGGMIGLVSLTESQDLVANFSRVGIRGSIDIPSPGVHPDKDQIGGIFGGLAITDSTNLRFNLNQSYFDGSINVNSRANFLGGLIGRYYSSNSSTSSTSFTNNYINLENFNVTGPLTQAFGLIGGVTNLFNYSFSDVYFRAPDQLVDLATQAAEPSNVGGYVRLTPLSVLQQSSYLGTGWNFTSVWRSNNGVRPPRLR